MWWQDFTSKIISGVLFICFCLFLLLLLVWLSLFPYSSLLADLLTVSETATEPPQEEGVNLNSPKNLALEATFINHNFSQQVLKIVSHFCLKRITLSWHYFPTPGLTFPCYLSNLFSEFQTDTKQEEAHQLLGPGEVLHNLTGKYLQTFCVSYDVKCK